MAKIFQKGPALKQTEQSKSGFEAKTPCVWAPKKHPHKSVFKPKNANRKSLRFLLKTNGSVKLTWTLIRMKTSVILKF